MESEVEIRGGGWEHCRLFMEDRIGRRGRSCPMTRLINLVMLSIAQAPMHPCIGAWPEKCTGCSYEISLSSDLP